MTGLKNLSKLRQYSADQNLSGFMTTQHRQNMLAIESSLNDLSKPATGCIIQTNTLIVPNNARSQLAFNTDFFVDPYGLIKNNTLVVQENGYYEFDFSILNLFIQSDRGIFLEVYQGSTPIKSILLFSTTDTSTVRLSCSAKTWLPLKAKDILSFYIFNEGGISVNEAGFDSAMIKMTKLII